MSLISIFNFFFFQKQMSFGSRYSRALFSYKLLWFKVGAGTGRDILNKSLFSQFIIENDGVSTCSLLNGRFSVVSVYEAIRQHTQKPPWHKILQLAPCVQKHNFITWMAILDRLPTIDRLNSWGMNLDPTCKLCNLENESSQKSSIHWLLVFKGNLVQITLSV